MLLLLPSKVLSYRRKLWNEKEIRSLMFYVLFRQNERTFIDNCTVFFDTFVRLSRSVNVPHYILFAINSFLLCRAYTDDINYNVIFRERNLLREKMWKCTVSNRHFCCNAICHKNIPPCLFYIIIHTRLEGIFKNCINVFLCSASPNAL